MVYNFDYAYLESVLGEKLLYITESEQVTIQRFYDALYDYDEHDIAIQSYPVKADKPLVIQCLSQISPTPDSVFAELVDEHVADIVNPETTFYERRVAQIIQVLYEFAYSPSTYGVVFLNISLLPNRYPATIQALTSLGQNLSTESRCIHIEFGVNADFINGDGLSSLLKRHFCHNDLTNSRVLLFTTYASLGAGKNIQRHLAQHEKAASQTLSINYLPDDETDCDFIYAERPTNLISASDEDVDIWQQQKLMLTITMYQLYQSDRFSYATLYRLTKQLEGLLQPSEWAHTIAHDYRNSPIDDANAAIVARVFQSIGRLCRTKNKSPNIYLLYDVGLAAAIVNDPTIYTFTSPEIRQLKASAQEYADKKKSDPWFIKLIRQARRIATENVYLLNSLRNDITRYWHCSELSDSQRVKLINNITTWEALRQYVLQVVGQVTCNRRVHKYSRVVFSIPAEDSSYLYAHLVGDIQQYKNTASLNFFDDAQAYISNKDYVVRVVSEQTAQLPILRKNPVFKQYCLAHDIPVQWQSSELQLCPVLFQAVYVAALGESAGVALLAGQGLRCEAIPPMLYELMDFQIANDTGTTTYIDFKHYCREATIALNHTTQMIHKTLDKLQEHKIAKGIVCGIVGDANDQCTFLNHDGQCLNSLSNTNLLIIPAIMDKDGQTILKNIELIQAYVDHNEQMPI